MVHVLSGPAVIFQIHTSLNAVEQRNKNRAKTVIQVVFILCVCLIYFEPTQWLEKIPTSQKIKKKKLECTKTQNKSWNNLERKNSLHAQLEENKWQHVNPLISQSLRRSQLTFSLCTQLFDMKVLCKTSQRNRLPQIYIGSGKWSDFSTKQKLCEWMLLKAPRETNQMQEHAGVRCNKIQSLAVES